MIEQQTEAILQSHKTRLPKKDNNAKGSRKSQGWSESNKVNTACKTGHHKLEVT